MEAGLVVMSVGDRFREWRVKVNDVVGLVVGVVLWEELACFWLLVGGVFSIRCGSGWGSAPPGTTAGVGGGVGYLVVWIMRL